ncbi:MAG: hypothetical protein U0271_16420 [Polyangiaceae bacterium]
MNRRISRSLMIITLAGAGAALAAYPASAFASGGSGGAREASDLVRAHARDTVARTYASLAHKEERRAKQEDGIARLHAVKGIEDIQAGLWFDGARQLLIAERDFARADRNERLAVSNERRAAAAHLANELHPLAAIPGCTVGPSAAIEREAEARAELREAHRDAARAATERALAADYERKALAKEQRGDKNAAKEDVSLQHMATALADSLDTSAVAREAEGRAKLSAAVKGLWQVCARDSAHS